MSWSFDVRAIFTALFFVLALIYVLMDSNALEFRSEGTMENAVVERVMVKPAFHAEDRKSVV